jgi:hypothetical protein
MEPGSGPKENSVIMLIPAFDEITLQSWEAVISCILFPFGLSGFHLFSPCCGP